MAGADLVMAGGGSFGSFASEVLLVALLVVAVATTVRRIVRRILGLVRRFSRGRW